MLFNLAVMLEHMLLPFRQGLVLRGRVLDAILHGQGLFVRFGAECVQRGGLSVNRVGLNGGLCVLWAECAVLLSQSDFA